MSGEEIQRDVVEEMLYRATLKQSFQSDVEEIRRIYGIPECGFKNRSAAEKWWLGEDEKLHSSADFDQGIWDLLSKHYLPQGANGLLESYVLINNFKFLPKLAHNFFICEYEEILLTPSAMEKRWLNSNKKFIRLYISEDTSLPMVKAYLDEHWRSIRKLVFLKTKKQKTIRRSKNSKRDELIWKLYQKTRIELGLTRGEYKDVRVSTILELKYGIKVTPENIRKIVQRMRTLRDS
ncbi:hypothetical protein COU13_00805 [Candidatus Kaiserbacteria bacterium CG10_big_fil_rev_8_21_14_0_10_43_70]|uniref:Uncharacterized protein n=1 Tax=Candidatus Kaiserbacteria bacterium CG10_big_fil_rev_8_21_14_0_10_43_70 TaxID=1974605 RepID=A0A2H0UJ86_9BACT|nr:MAG: hypothetical protein COU13_00805 [Candidatus Kaiserbacteria bacterium CG10_big_fil_rev_8_21_14_0_10_43_70]